MLGLVGFLSVAILFIVYGRSAASTRPRAFRQRSYASAYYLLGAACTTWALTSLLSANSLQSGVLVGDALVLIGTVFMTDAAVSLRYRKIALIGSSLVGVGALAVRVIYFAPHAYVRGGILVFNSPKNIAALFTSLFVLVWFPITMRFVVSVLRNSPFKFVVRAGILACALAVIGVSGFVSATTNQAIIVYFVVLGCSFASLIGIDYLSKQETING